MRSALFLALILLSSTLAADAAVVVITNRSDRQASFRIETAGDRERPGRTYELAAGDCRPIWISGPAKLLLTTRRSDGEFGVLPGRMYYFGAAEKELTLTEIGLEDPPQRPGRSVSAIPAITPDKGTQAEPSILTIPVKILYDDAEILTEAAWEARMRRRFEEASRIFRDHCFVEFKVVSCEAWHRPSSAQSLRDVLGEFERKVDPTPAQLAIGFLAERIDRPKDGHLGGTRGPLSRHLLVHERANQNMERECLELLVHELGHFLGAAHSPEPNSVMRPILGDRLARSQRFKIVFDPLNTMAMCVVRRELGLSRAVRFGHFGASSREELTRIYYNLGRAIQDDPAPAQFLQLLGVSLPGATRNALPENR